MASKRKSRLLAWSFGAGSLGLQSVSLNGAKWNTCSTSWPELRILYKSLTKKVLKFVEVLLQSGMLILAGSSEEGIGTRKKNLLLGVLKNGKGYL
jgi:hypothetical protein